MAQEIVDEAEGVEHAGMIPTEMGQLAVLASAEIDKQISTARAHPRSITKFRQTGKEMVTMSEGIARECIYALPRAGKVIEGPSIRFAEIVANAWGNMRNGARVIDIGREFVTTQGFCHDLERNIATTFEVRRRITNARGERYNADMIGVTSNAAASIALRNAILRVVPKAFWAEIYYDARSLIAGDIKTLPSRRAEMMKAAMVIGATPEKIYGVLGVKGVDDITIEHMIVISGLLTAIKNGDTTLEEAFSEVRTGPAPPKPERETAATTAKPTEKKKKAGEAKAAPAAEVASKAAETIPPVAGEVQKTETAATSAAPKKDDGFKDWLDDQYKTLERATLIRTVDDLQDDVTAQLKNSPEELTRWTNACNEKARVLNKATKK